MGLMRVLNHEGHAELEWDTDDEVSEQRARGEFERLRGRGFVPFSRKASEEPFERATTFQPSDAEIYWLRPLQGG